MSQKRGLSQNQIKSASNAIKAVDSKLHSQFLNLMTFLLINPEFQGKIRGKNPPTFGSDQYFEKTAKMFSEGRSISPPINSGKETDNLLKLLFQNLNPNLPIEISTATRIHGDFMVLENKVGKILESYLAHKLEPLRWIWCSGDFVDKIDFVKIGDNFSVNVLQVKNKDVTENSSSSKGRGNIPKWSRLKGKAADPDWHNFPDVEARKLISEKEFLDYGEKICKIWLKK